MFYNKIATICQAFLQSNALSDTERTVITRCLLRLWLGSGSMQHILQVAPVAPRSC